MTQEDKELLLKDLCARLPYGVKVWRMDEDGYIVTDLLTPIVYESFSMEIMVKECKPYLIPMSQIGEFFGGLSEYDIEHPFELFDSPIDAIDYFLEHHFDYRGLIEKGIALEAPEGMYIIKN